MLSRAHSLWCPALQVLKDLFALDDGISKTAPRRELGNSLCKSGLVPLLLSFLVALGPIRTRAHALSWDPDSFRSEDSPIASSLKKAAAIFPRHPPYCGFRTDVVAGTPGPCVPAPQSCRCVLNAVSVVICEWISVLRESASSCNMFCKVLVHQMIYSCTLQFLLMLLTVGRMSRMRCLIWVAYP